jgi:hypothetical protein
MTVNSTNYLGMLELYANASFQQENAPPQSNIKMKESAGYTKALAPSLP